MVRWDYSCSLDAGVKQKAMTDEQKMLAAFRAMDDRAKGEILETAQAKAKAHPAQAVRLLRLVPGNAK